MALSGVYQLNLTFEDIRDEALQRLQVIGDGESVTTSESDKVKSTLNIMLKDWESQGIHLWTYQEGSLFCEEGRSEYNLNTSARAGNNFVSIDLAVDALTGATSVITDIPGNEADKEKIVVGVNIGFIYPDRAPHWTTVTSVSPVGNVIGFTDALPADLDAGASIYYYSADMIPIRRILNVRRWENSDYEIPIVFESRADYFNLPNKSQNGTPIQAYYSRQEPQGIFYVWSPPNREGVVINFTYEREMQIIDADTDDIDFPSYWYEAIIMNLCDRLKYKFSVSPERISFISQEARLRLDEALSFDNAVYPITIKMQQYG